MLVALSTASRRGPAIDARSTPKTVKHNVGKMASRQLRDLDTRPRG